MTDHVHLSIMDHIATLTIARPEVHNAFNEEMIQQFTRHFEQLNASEEVRVILLTSVGKTFSAGADIQWMQRIATFSEKDNLQEAKHLADMFRMMRESPKPVVARVQGPAFGGGIGLIAASDIAIALNSATFSFTEVKLGIFPATITPYLLEKMGPGHMRRYALTAEPFHAEEALRMGLLSEVVDSITKLNERTAEICYALRANSGKAIAAYKKLLSEVEKNDWKEVGELTSRRLAQARHSPEGQEGLKAFLEKRKPNF